MKQVIFFLAQILIIGQSCHAQAITDESTDKHNVATHAGSTQIMSLPPDTRMTQNGLKTSTTSERILLSLENDARDNSASSNCNDKLVHASKETSMELPDCTVKLSRGALALLSNGDGWTAVHNIHDRHNASFYIRMGSLDLPLRVGEEIIFASSPAKLVDLLANCAIGRRGLQMYQLPDGRAVALSETRFADLVHKNQLLLTIFQSDDRFHNDIQRKTTKTAACKMIASHYKGPYHKFVLGGKRQSINPISTEILQEMKTLAKHPSRGGFKGM